MVPLDSLDLMIGNWLLLLNVVNNWEGVIIQLHRTTN